LRSFPIILATALGTFFLLWLLATIAVRVTGVPKGFPPFTALPLLSGVAGGFLGAALVYSMLRAFTTQPDRLFLFVALGLLALSFSLPLRLSFTKSVRFQGVTPAAQMVLAMFHTMIAASAVTVLTRTFENSR
jgi:hypothetical protein